MPVKSSLAQADLNKDFPAIVLGGTSQKVAVTGTSAQSTAIAATTTLVKLHGTVDMHIKIGTNPTALADGTCLFLPANTSMIFGIPPSSVIAAIRDSSSGNLFITEGA